MGGGLPEQRMTIQDIGGTVKPTGDRSDQMENSPDHHLLLPAGYAARLAPNLHSFISDLLRTGRGRWSREVKKKRNTGNAKGNNMGDKDPFPKKKKLREPINEGKQASVK